MHMHTHIAAHMHEPYAHGYAITEVLCTHTNTSKRKQNEFVHNF